MFRVDTFFSADFTGCDEYSRPDDAGHKDYDCNPA